MEHEKSKSLSKIKAIRGLSPKKDMAIQIPEGSEQLLVSKVYCDSRFKAIAQSQMKVERVDYNFLRIKS